MAITVTYLAKLADLLGISEEIIAFDAGSTDDLLRLLRERGGDWEAALSPENVYKIAVNNAITHEAISLQDGDQVAFLPPVTGG